MSENSGTNVETQAQRAPYRSAGEWGFTNDVAVLKGAQTFRDDAVADGWDIEPTYPSHEPVDSACRLRRSGYVMLILTREKVGKFGYEAKVNIWGPDGLAIKTPEYYDFAAIEQRTRSCSYCRADDVETVRVGFAGRCCNACLPEMRKRIETPGWTN